MPFQKPIPRPFMPIAVRTYAPLEPGVYGISNAREWIYIGQTDNIQSALLAHLHDPLTTIMKQQPTGFVFEVCDETQRTSRQDRLIHEYEPKFSRQGPRHS